MESREDSRFPSMPNFGQIQPGPEWPLDPAFSNQSLKGPFCDLENVDPTTGNSGFAFSPAAQTQQPQIYLDIHMDDMNMPPDLTWLPGTGVDLSTATSDGPIIYQGRAAREASATGNLKIDSNHLLKKRTMPNRIPLDNRPFLMPTPRISRPNRPRSSVIRTATRASLRKVNSTRKGKAEIKGFQPMKLIRHLENEFQSNSTVSRGFKLKSSEIIGQLINLIDYEILHGSSGAKMFLSPEEEEEEDDLSSARSPEIVSPSFNLPLPSPDFNSSSEIYPDILDYASEPAQYSQTYTLPSRHKNNKTIYHCTYSNCGRAFTSPADWKRHEEIEKHWLQKRYMCLKCDIAIANTEDTVSCAFCSMFLPSLNDAEVHCLQCQDAREGSRTFARKDKFRDHLRDEHMIANILDYMESWTFAVKSDWPRQCGFCGVILSNWEERASHIEEHYKQGAKITDWKLPFPSAVDSEMQYSDTYHGYDSDDGNGNGGDGNLDQSGGPGNSSSAARVVGQGISSNSTGKEPQSYYVSYRGNSAHQRLQTILPVAHCNLEDYMAETDKTSLYTKRVLDLLHWQMCLLPGIAYLHKHKIKRGNVLLTNISTKYGEIFFSGFSLALIYALNPAKGTRSEIENKEFSFASMPCAPEVASRTTNGLPSDLFSLVYVLLEMLTFVHKSPRKYTDEDLTNNTDLKVCRRKLELAERWIDPLNSESQVTTEVGDLFWDERIAQNMWWLYKFAFKTKHLIRA